jgi:phosphonate transport system permease protein
LQSPSFPIPSCRRRVSTSIEAEREETTIFWWEFNVRASTVLVVGAGGIGQELKNSMDLLLFPRLLTIILLILVTVTVIDQASAWLRRRLE